MKIGLEVHVALPTKTKLFCSSSTEATEPNSAICPVCMGFPGAKPMLNKEALAIALNIAHALNCDIDSSHKIAFVRKVYFYPDLPKSYQITQLYDPIGQDGHVTIASKAKKKQIRIRRIQLEEDPAKVLREKEYTLIDFNRSGIPLVEIVTEPDITEEAELREFISELKSILYYIGVDIDRELKVDLNVSVLEEKVEVKNITGLKHLADAAKYEIKRQQSLAETGRKVLAETRSYDENKMQTVSSREKETEEEYGFIYEPDLTFFNTKGIQLRKAVIASKIAEEYASKYHANPQTLLEFIRFDRDALALIDYAKDKWQMQTIINVIEVLKKYGRIGIKTKDFEKLLNILKAGTPVSEEIVKRVEKGMKIQDVMVSSEEIDAEIRELIKIKDNLIKEYNKNPRVFNFIIGEVSKKHKANPKYVSERLKIVLEKDFKFKKKPN